MSRFSRRNLLLGVAAFPLIPLSSPALAGLDKQLSEVPPEPVEPPVAEPVAARMQAEIEQNLRTVAKAEGWQYHKYPEAILQFDLPAQPGDLSFPGGDVPDIFCVRLRRVLLQINPNGSGVLWYDHIYGPKQGLELLNREYAWSNDTDASRKTTTGLLYFLAADDEDGTKNVPGTSEFELRKLDLMYPLRLRNVYTDHATPEEAKVLATRQSSLNGAFHFGEVIEHHPQDLDFENYHWGEPANWATDAKHLEMLKSADQYVSPYWYNGYGRALVMTPEWQQQHLSELRTSDPDYLKGVNVTLLDTQDGKMYVVPETWAIERDWQVQYIDARNGGGANLTFHPLTAAQSYFYSQHFCPCHRKQAAKAAGAVVLSDACEGKRFLIYKIEHRDAPGLILYTEVMSEYDLLNSLRLHCKPVTG